MKKALRELVMSILEPWKKAEAAMLKTLFSGTAEGLNSLALQLRNGLALNKIQSVDQEGFANDTLKLVYAAMLPLAWNESTQEVEESPNRLYPMIL